MPILTPGEEKLKAERTKSVDSLGNEDDLLKAIQKCSDQDFIHSAIDGHGDRSLDASKHNSEQDGRLKIPLTVEDEESVDNSVMSLVKDLSGRIAEQSFGFDKDEVGPTAENSNPQTNTNNAKQSKSSCNNNSSETLEKERNIGKEEDKPKKLDDVRKGFVDSRSKKIYIPASQESSLEISANDNNPKAQNRVPCPTSNPKKVSKGSKKSKTRDWGPAFGQNNATSLRTSATFKDNLDNKTIGANKKPLSINVNKSKSIYDALEASPRTSSPNSSPPTTFDYHPQERSKTDSYDQYDLETKDERNFKKSLEGVNINTKSIAKTSKVYNEKHQSFLYKQKHGSKVQRRNRKLSHSSSGAIPTFKQKAVFSLS